jgi:hypothetical protein
VNGSTVQLRQYSDDAIVNSLVSVSGNVITIRPVADLSNDTQYYISISGVQDAAGNSGSYSTKAAQEFRTALQANGSLAVTGINALKTYATADNSYENGWSWKFLVTVPSNQTAVKLKFNDWSNGSTTFAAANNIRYYSAQSNKVDAASAVTIGAANSYPATEMIATGDLDANTAGKQIEVTVEAKLPVGTSGGSFSTSYGISTAPILD